MKAKARTDFDIAAVLSTGRNRYTFKAEAGTATIDVFGEIDDWWGFGVREMAYNLSQNKGKKLNINIHSPGGSILEGVGIANLIKSHDAQTTTTGIGFVASIASVILLAGDTVRMARNAFLMIHNPWSLAVGDSEELRKTADTLDKMENQLANVYVTAMQKRGKDTGLDEVKQMMRDETWFTAEEAKDAGLIDEITDRVEITDTPEDAEQQAETLARFKNIPQALADQYNLFSNTKTKAMAKDSKSLFARLGELFATAAEEIEAPEDQAQQTTETETDTTSATMTVEDARRLLEGEGYTVTQAATEEQEADEAEEELAELVALRAQVEDLTKAVKRKVGAQSGGATDTGTKEKSELTEAHLKAFGNLANIVRSYMPL